MPDEPKRERLPQVEAQLQKADAIAHGVNNPLAVVRANVEFLRETVARIRQGFPDSPEIKSCLDDAEVCLGDLRQAVDQIGDVVRPLGDGGEPPPLRSSLRPKALDPSFRPGRILVVDDQEGVTRVLRRILRGHEVVTFVSPRAALDRIALGDRFDVIFCDVMMSELNGAMLYAEIRKIAPDQTRRMVFITGGATTDETKRFVATVTQPIFPKPFEPSQLRAIAQQIIATGEATILPSDSTHPPCPTD